MLLTGRGEPVKSELIPASLPIYILGAEVVKSSLSTILPSTVKTDPV